MSNWLIRKIVHIRRSRTRKTSKALAAAEFDRRVDALGAGDVAIDLGANYGEITARFAHTGAQVHAFEPDPVTFGHLSKAVGAFPNVVLHQKAVGVEDGEVTLYRSSDIEGDERRRSEGSTIVADARRIDHQDSVRVSKVNFLGFLAGLDANAAIVKMDIEGAEVELLEALLDDGLIYKIDALFVETHERMIPQLFDRYMALRQRIAALDQPYINLDWK